MELSAVFFLLAVLVLIGMYLYAPFVTRLTGANANTREQQELSSLMAERDRVVNALQELDFDHNLGKIPEEDYPAQRSELLKKGAALMRRLDEFQPPFGPASGPDAVSRLEAAVAARRADGANLNDSPTSVPGDLSDDEIESLIAARRKQRKEKSAGFCPRCGQAVLVSDRFCPSCGKSLH
jgi:hypothetical protein